MFKQRTRVCHNLFKFFLEVRFVFVEKVYTYERYKEEKLRSPKEAGVNKVSVRRSS